MKALYRHRLLIGAALLTLGGGVTYGCRDFLDTPAQGSLEEADLLTRQGVEGTLVAAYRALDWNNGVGGAWGNTASNWVWGSVASDDAYKGSEASDQPAITDVELYNWTTGQADGYLNDRWRGVYEGVVRSNATLRLLRKVLAEKPGEISATTANGIRGEALFLRAHYHFEAWRMWGKIPYYFEDDTTDFRKPNNLSVDSVASLIINDLDAAITAPLPLTPRNGDKGRATQWTAKAYKGRVQVYAGRFAAALTTLQEVRASNVYALEQSYDRVWTGFPEFANGKETIFAYQASANDGEPDGNNANYGERLNFPHSGSPFGCCGFHQPSQNLVNFFAVDATGLPLAVTSPATWNTNDAEVSAGSTIPVDPRLDWTVGRDGVGYKDWGAHDSTWIRAPSYGGPYSPKKNVHERTSGAQSQVGWLPAQLNSVRIHLFRYADLLLLLAEAEVEVGILENARTIVNEIRRRAGRVAQGAGTDRATITVPLDTTTTIDSLRTTYAIYRIGEYTTPFASQAAARTAVRTERRLELAMEGQRFFDLRRWERTDPGIVASTLNAYIAEESTRRSHLTAAAAVTTRYNLYPIPQVQIELSQVGGQDRIVQNTGW